MAAEDPEATTEAPSTLETEVVEEVEEAIRTPIQSTIHTKTGRQKKKATTMKMEVLQVIQGEIGRGSLLMKTKEEENHKEETEAYQMVKENTEGKEVTVETEETTTTEAAGRGSEDTAKGVSVSEGLL